jgi:hypothetical protein
MNQDIEAFQNEMMFHTSHPTEMDAVRLAWHDTCRTFHGAKHYHKAMADAFATLAKELLPAFREKTSQMRFDEYHDTLCQQLIKTIGPAFHYGMAQKVVNMSYKYLIVMGKIDPQDDQLSHLHVPVDSYVLKAARDLGVVTSIGAWSQMSQKEYEDFQWQLRRKIGEECPILWEFRIWNTTAAAKLN